jgi:hypothetical protein
MPDKPQVRHGSRLRTIVRKALEASRDGRVTTSDIAQLAYPHASQWPLDRGSYAHCRRTLQSYAEPIGRLRKGKGRPIIWEARR